MDSPEPESREEQNALAFLEALSEESGLVMRPVSYLTMQNVALIGLKWGKDREARKTLSQEELLDEMNAYFFIQAAPGATVSRAIRAYRKAIRAGVSREDAWENFLCESVEPFLGTLSLEKKTS